jgi:hypothetical protein
MGWIAITKTGELLREEDGIGRPVEAGNNGELIVIAQSDFGHNVAVDLRDGSVYLEYETIGVQNGTPEIANSKIVFYICEETNIVGEYKHLTQEIVDARDENGRKILHEGRYFKVRNDILTDLIWRPIWFTRVIGGVPTKIIGAQTTTPDMQGARNVKKLISIFADGKLGID